MNKAIRTALDGLYASAPERTLSPGAPFVIFSDLHLGTGTSKDDFVPNAPILMGALEKYYYPKGWSLILNGDIEELYKFSIRDIMKRWAAFYTILDRFNDADRLIKLVGNHDLALSVGCEGYPYRVFAAVKLKAEYGTLFLLHGHQGSRIGPRLKSVSKGVVRYLAKPFGINNYSISKDSRAKYRLERNIYSFSAKKRCLTIIGHTHRPLFESLSRIDELRFSIEDICRRYPGISAKEREAARIAVRQMRMELEHSVKKEGRRNYRRSLYNKNVVLPVLFNSGSVIGKHGVTGIEIADDQISLVQWSVAPPDEGSIEGTGFKREVWNSERLDSVFARIELLGE
jgi:hypothetical protein